MEASNATTSIMNTSELSEHVVMVFNAASEQFHKLPGSAIFLRYVQSSYQNDPVRSAVELFLVLFAIRYLLAPKYSTKPNYVKLSEEVSAMAGQDKL
jgi:serine palmitoyltransferase